jgi:NADPH-dependent curcumin reductase CurA
VVQSENATLPVGALVQGLTNWQEYSIGDPAGLIPPTVLPTGTPPNLALSIFGVTSLTAYFGLLDVGQPKPGETVLVSGAAGATGSVVAQIARLQGCRVVGIAGGREKCEWLRSACKLDAVIDYKLENLQQRIAEHCPGGVDVFFDNVGGQTLEVAIAQMADFGRIVLCGAIASYNDTAPQPGPRNMMLLVTRRLRMQGFIVLDYLHRANEAIDALATWVMAGEIAWREDIQEGFENIPVTLQRLFTGSNVGKQLLKLADPD